MKTPLAILPIRKIFISAGMLTLMISAVPAANAMVVHNSDEASSAGTDYKGTHNTDPATAPTDISKIWNRTIRTGNGTATYLGQNAAGQHLILTAAHVGTYNLSITENYSLSATSSSWILTNTGTTSNSKADLKIVAVTANSPEMDSYLRSLGNISIAEGITTQAEANQFRRASTLYTIGTGRSTDIGGNPMDESGTYPRQKQWATFTAYQKEAILIGSVDKNNNLIGTTACYTEIFTQTETSVQATTQDSGSGVFVFQNGDWVLSGTLIGINGNSTSANTVGYTETENSICRTYIADLSVYADQINAIMNIPEPSAFGLFAGLGALVIACTRRSPRQ